MSLSFRNCVNCLLIIGLSNNLTTVTQGGIPVKLHSKPCEVQNLITGLNYTRVGPMVL